MHKKLNWVAALCLLFALTFQSVSHAQKPVVGDIYIVNQFIKSVPGDNPVGVPVLFTLFKSGEVVRSSELSVNGFGGTPNASWQNLPVGAYELHCEAIGFGKLVRKIAVGPGERADFTLNILPEKDEVQGAGPTLFEMQRKITLLEKQNAELKERLAALEKAK